MQHRLSPYQNGLDRCVVLDRNELTSGSTFHSAGLVGRLRSDVNLTRMIQYSTNLYRQLKDETGVEPDWREVGSLRLDFALTDWRGRVVRAR